MPDSSLLIWDKGMKFMFVADTEAFFAKYCLKNWHHLLKEIFLEGWKSNFLNKLNWSNIAAWRNLQPNWYLMFGQGVPWHSGNYRVWIQSEMRDRIRTYSHPVTTCDNNKIFLSYDLRLLSFFCSIRTLSTFFSRKVFSP